MKEIEISKSSRHSKITGNYSEQLVLYWLSKTGFESMYVDHVGIDLIAYNKHTDERMGISVKSRSRTVEHELSHLNIGPKDQTVKKIKLACDPFKLVPYLSIVVDFKDTAKIFILSLEHYFKIHNPKKMMIWYMSKKWLEKYKKDPEIKMIEFKHKITNWWE